MKSNATTVREYLASLPTDRRAGLEAVRKIILQNLDKDYEECMLWGVAAYVVPPRVWPAGHHTDPSKPLMMCGMSSQKNDMVVYLMNVYGGGGGLGGDATLRAWFENAWAKSVERGAGKQLGMCVKAAGSGGGGGGGGGGGCCIRFKKIQDLALDVIGEAIRRTPAKRYVENYVKTLTSTRRRPVEKKLKGEPVARTATTKTTKKTAKKVATQKVKKGEVARKSPKRQ